MTTELCTWSQQVTHYVHIYFAETDQ